MREICVFKGRWEFRKQRQNSQLVKQRFMNMHHFIMMHTDNRDYNLKTKNFKDIMCAQDFQNQNFFNQINSSLSEFFLKIIKKYTWNRIISIWDVSKKYFLTFHNSCARYNLLWKYITFYFVRNILWPKIPFNQFSKTPLCFSEFSATLWSSF